MDKLSKWILSFDIANGSDLAAAALSDLRVRIWKLESGEMVHELSYSEPETDLRLKLEDEVEPVTVRFSPDGKFLAVSFLSRIHIYDVETWREGQSLGVAGEDDHRPDLKVTPSTPQLQKRSAQEARAQAAVPPSDLNQSVREWAHQREIGDGRTRITDFNFTRDGAHMLAAYCRGGCYASRGRRWNVFPTGDDPLRFWDVRARQILWERKYDLKGVLNRIVLSPDGEHFAAVDRQLGRCGVGVYNLSDGNLDISLPFSPLCDPPPNILFIEDGESFIANRAETEPRKKKPWNHLAMYETRSGKLIGDFSRRDTVRYADLSRDGRWLASTTRSGLRFQVWDISTRTPVLMQTPREWLFKGPLLTLARFSPDGRWLVVGSREMGDLVVYQIDFNQ